MSDTATVKVLRVLQQKRWMCIHELFLATGLIYCTLRKTLAQLESSGRILRKCLEGQNNNMIVYGLLSFEQVAQNSTYIALKPSPDMLEANSTSPVIGMSEAEAWGRVHMLKQMRSKLVVTWHPILDKIIADYLRDLKRTEKIWASQQGLMDDSNEA